jgi:hypothetical protein
MIILRSVIPISADLKTRAPLLSLTLQDVLSGFVFWRE